MNDAETQRLSAELSAAQAVLSIMNDGEAKVLTRDFYTHNGQWVYRWADERLTLNYPPAAPILVELAPESAEAIVNAVVAERDAIATELSAAQTRLTQTAQLADEFALLADEGGRTPPADDNGIKIGLSIAYEDAAQRLHAILAGSPRPNTQDGAQVFRDTLRSMTTSPRILETLDKLDTQDGTE